MVDRRGRGSGTPPPLTLDAADVLDFNDDNKSDSPKPHLDAGSATPATDQAPDMPSNQFNPGNGGHPAVDTT